MEHVSAKIIHDGITFDDVLLIPARSYFIPAEADTHAKLTRTIELNIPLISAPMDTVTESALAIALAQEGGIGIIHKNLSIQNQSREVEKVKRSENGVIVDPISLPPHATIATARKIMREYNVSGIPIVECSVTYRSTPPRCPSSSSPRWRSEQHSIPACGRYVASSSAGERNVNAR